MSEHTMVCPFLNGEPAYAHGVEFGMLYCQMRDSDEPVEGYFHRENQDQILLAASRLGWTAEDIKAHDDFWFWVRLEPPEER